MVVNPVKSFAHNKQTNLTDERYLQKYPENTPSSPDTGVANFVKIDGQPSILTSHLALLLMLFLEYVRNLRIFRVLRSRRLTMTRMTRPRIVFFFCLYLPSNNANRLDLLFSVVYLRNISRSTFINSLSFCWRLYKPLITRCNVLMLM